MYFFFQQTFWNISVLYMIFTAILPSQTYSTRQWKFYSTIAIIRSNKFINALYFHLITEWWIHIHVCQLLQPGQCFHCAFSPDVGKKNSVYHYTDILRKKRSSPACFSFVRFLNVRLHHPQQQEKFMAHFEWDLEILKFWHELFLIIGPIREPDFDLQHRSAVRKPKIYCPLQIKTEMYTEGEWCMFFRRT